MLFTISDKTEHSQRQQAMVFSQIFKIKQQTW